MGIVGYTIWGALILVALCVLCTILFSARGIFYGKVEPVSVGIMAIPVALFIILGLVMETWVVGGIWTMLILSSWRCWRSWYQVRIVCSHRVWEICRILHVVDRLIYA